jgi:hypothetical protein
MLYDTLWEIVALADWRLMAVALAVGAFVVAAVLIWNRSRIGKRIGTNSDSGSGHSDDESLIPNCAAAIPLSGVADIPIGLEPANRSKRPHYTSTSTAGTVPAFISAANRCRFGEGFVRREREERRERFEDRRERRERFEDRR